MYKIFKIIKNLSKNNNKLHIIGIVGVPGSYGGFETLVDNILNSKKLKNIDVFVYCEKDFLKHNHDVYKNANLININLKANGWQSIFYDLCCIILGCFAGGNILILGTSATFIIPILRIFFPQTKFIVNMAGLEWSRSKWNMPARKFLKFNERMAAKYAHNLIADNEGLCEYVKKEYKCGSIFIPYGGDQYLEVKSNNKVFQKYNLPKDFDFGMARAQIDNNIEIILDAYTNIERNIVFVSNWNNNEYGKYIAKKYNKYKNIFLIGPIYDISQIKALHSRTIFYIHGHSAGGTNPVLVESMWSKLPIVAFDVSFNRFTTGNYAYYFNNSNELQEILFSENLNAMAENIDKMWKRTNKLYVWDKIISKYEEIIL